MCSLSSLHSSMHEQQTAQQLLVQVRHTSPSAFSSSSSQPSNSDSDDDVEVQAATGRAGRRVRKGPISRGVELELLQAIKKPKKPKRVCRLCTQSSVLHLPLHAKLCRQSTLSVTMYVCKTGSAASALL